MLERMIIERDVPVFRKARGGGLVRCDAARTYLLFWLSGDINLAEKYLNLFCLKSDTAKQYVQKWIPIVAASQLVKGKKEEREFLLHWVDVVDYE